MFCKNFFTIFASISYFSQGKDSPFYFLEHFLIVWFCYVAIFVKFVSSQFLKWELYSSTGDAYCAHRGDILFGAFISSYYSFLQTPFDLYCFLVSSPFNFCWLFQICSFIMRDNLLWATFSYSCSQWVASAFPTSPPLSLELSVLSCTSATDGTLKAKFLDLLHCEKAGAPGLCGTFQRGHRLLNNLLHLSMSTYSHEAVRHGLHLLATPESLQALTYCLHQRLRAGHRNGTAA